MMIKEVPGQVLYQKSAGLAIRIVPRGQVQFCVARTDFLRRRVVVMKHAGSFRVGKVHQ